MSRSDIIDIIVIIKHETVKAILVDHGGKEPCWLPRSAIEIVEVNPGGKTHTISLPQSLAEEKGII